MAAECRDHALGGALASFGDSLDIVGIPPSRSHCHEEAPGFLVR
jgi:hypothetical protein